MTIYVPCIYRLSVCLYCLVQCTPLLLWSPGLMTIHAVSVSIFSNLCCSKCVRNADGPFMIAHS
jgi:hypothetical protein